MNAALFTFEKYSFMAGYTPWDLTKPSLISEGPPSVWGFSLQPGVKFLGSCRASALAVRPKAHGFAWMLAVGEEGTQAWHHADQESPVENN